MRKRILSLVLIFCMVLTLMPATAFAAAESSNEAKIGEQEYATLAAAVKAANTAGTADITLLKDVAITEDEVLKFTGTFDLGGHTLTAGIYDSNTGYNKNTSVGSGGNVTITNGTVTAATTDVLLVNNGGTLTLETNVTVTSTCPNNGAATLRNNGGTFNLNSGATIKTEATYPTSVITAGKGVTNIDGATITVNGKNCPAVYMYNVSGNDGGTVNFKSGTITGNSTYKSGTVYFYESNDRPHVFNMSGGTITGGQYGVQISGSGTFDMTGGEITNCGIGVSGNGTNNNQNTVVNISGDAKIDVGVGNVGIYQPQNGTTTISDNAVISGDSAIALKSGKLNINGGTLTAVGTTDGSHPTSGANLTTDSSVIVVDDNAGNYYGHIVVNITGGTFTSKESSAISIIRSESTGEAQPQISISGGTFTSGKYGTESTEAPDIYVAEDANTNAQLAISGGAFSDNSASSYLASSAVTLPGDNGGVVVYASEDEAEAQAVATVGIGEETQYFGSLAAAVEAAAEDEADTDTVTLLNDAELSAAVNVTDDLTIKGAEGITITRASGNTGTFFTVADGKTLTLDGVTIDAGGKWTLDQTTWDADKAISLSDQSVYNGSWENSAQDPITVNSGNVTTNANLITLNGNSNLTLTGGTIIENIYATTNVHVIGVGATNNTINIDDATIKHFAGTGGSLIITTTDSGNKTITLGSKAVLTDNYNLGGNGGLFYLNSKDTLTMADGAKVTDNRGVNCNGTFIMTRSGAAFTMNGGLISGNEGLKGGSNGYCQPVYAHLSGSFTMTGGEITDNTGCYVGAFYQRIDDSTSQSSTGKVTLTGGKIYDNHYYGEGSGEFNEHSLGEMFITDEAEIGTGMNITGDVSFYGQAKATVNGNIDGNVYVYAEQYVAGVTDNNVALNGTITGNVIVENGAKATNTGTIQGNVTVEPQDTTDKNHSNGTFTNNGAISGTVTLEPGTSIQLGEGTVTAGTSGAKFTVSGTTVTLTEGTLNAKDCGNITFRDSDNNELVPANGNGNGEVMILVASVTHGSQVNMGFDSFAGAIAYAKEQSEANDGALYTVTLEKDAVGEGIDIAPAKDKTPVVVIDFNGHTYTLTNPPVGSGDAFKTQGIRTLAGSTVTLKNGTLAVSDENGTWDQNFIWLIHNYGDLTLENMTLDGTNLNKKGATDTTTYYTLYSECGKVTVTNTTFIDSTNTGKPYSIGCNYWDDYSDGTQITIDELSTFKNVTISRNDDTSTSADKKSYVKFGDNEYYMIFDPTSGSRKSVEFVKDGTVLKPVLPDSTLSYTALANADIVANCAAQTMWVQFNEALPANIWLWFEITDADGPVYGIAAQGNGTSTRFAWSFLNQGQFEMWPTGVTGIADGTYTVTCYVLPGKVTGTQTTSPTTKYLVWEKNVEVGNVSTYVPKPEVTVDDSKGSTSDVTAVTGAAQSTAIDDTNMNELASEALTDAENALPTTEEATETLGEIAKEGDTVQIVVETYLKVEVKEYTASGNDKKLTFDIKPMYQIVATTAENVEDIELEGDNPNAVTIGQPHELTVTKPVTMTLGVPTNFLNTGDTAYVQHVKDNGRTYYYKATTGSDNTITFTNPHGFSTFTVIATAPKAEAQIGDTLYPTLQDAIDHVKDGETIEVLTTEPLTATAPSAELSFKIVAGVTGEINVTVNGNGSYSVTKDGNTYTVTYTGSGNPTYTVTVPANPNGTVSVSPTSATAGTTITVTVTPKEGYSVDTVTVTQNGTGTAVTVTKNANGTYSFTMPAGGATVQVKFVEGTKPAPSARFTDVKETDWFVDAVDYVVEHGLMDGTGETTFAPTSATTRAMLVTILYRLDGEPAVTKNIPFSDVAAGQWYSDAINWAAANEIVGGYGDDTFRPMRDITREEAATILYRYATYKKYDVTTTAALTGYTDAASVQSYAAAPMSWAVGTELIGGTTATTLAPSGGAIRAQIATILMRFCENIVK